MTMALQDFSDRILKPKMVRLAQQIDVDGYVSAANTVYNLTGTAGTAPNNVSFLFDIGKKITSLLVRWYYGSNPDAQAAIDAIAANRRLT